MDGEMRTIRWLWIGDRAPGEAWPQTALDASRTVSFERLSTPSAGARAAARSWTEADLVLLQLTGLPPGVAPHEMVARIGAQAPRAAIVVVGERDDEALVVDLLRHGARGYLLEGEPDPRIVISTVVAALESQRTIGALDSAREQARHMASHDPLTSLPNRMLFNDRLAQAIAAARRNDRKVAVLFIDLDRFKQINDELGHDVGDALLQRVSVDLSADLRESDTAARLGGDEFAVLLTQIRNELDAAVVAEKLLASLRRPSPVAGRELRSSASIGIATFPRDGEDAESLLKKADTAMYHAKERGCDRAEFFTDEMNEAVLERVSLERGLRHAVERGQLHLHYVPQFDVRRGRLYGLETEVRWRHPELGDMEPSLFVPVAEDSGLIVGLGAWVLREACRQLADWRRQGHEQVRLAVDVSARELRDPGFLPMVREVLADAGLPPENLELEISEAHIVADPRIHRELLRELRELGVRAVIDHFGVGSSALAVLKHLPVDALKIDPSFVRCLPDDPADATITESIVRMARGLQLSTVASGVAREEQLLLLGSWGCTRMQGPLFAAPGPAEHFAEWVAGPGYRDIGRETPPE